ncbi:MAG: MarC family protein [Acetobacteraceae bacterium]|nr:MarC family protein [Acetobacteraceae bacterium]MDI3306928.1 MarC family protein [Acetobacteraceae bacterium]
MLSGIPYALVTLLVILDPPGTAALFVAMTPYHSPAQRRQQALRAVGIAFLVLVGFALGGTELLRAMGIGLPAMKVAGGLLLFLMAADMVMGRHLLRASPEEERAAAREDDISVFPLAIPLLAGPGAMTSVVLLHEQAGDDPWRLAGVLAALVIALGVTLACLLAANLVTRLLGATGANVIGRVLGVLLAALAAQIALEGVRESLG